MKKQKILNWEVSSLGLGGGKFVDIPESEGFWLADEALRLGINIFDGHHRYGKAEKIVGQYSNVIKMTKVSAYKLSEYKLLVHNSKQLMKRIDIMWVSDLDDSSLYDMGEIIYNDIKKDFPVLGITTENANQAQKFMSFHPECKFFMVPVFIGMPQPMIEFIKEAKQNGKYIFAIKPFIDGLLLKHHTVKECLEFVNEIGPHVTLVGTSKKEHLQEVVNIWKGLE